MNQHAYSVPLHNRVFIKNSDNIITNMPARTIWPIDISMFSILILNFEKKKMVTGNSIVYQSNIHFILAYELVRRRKKKKTILSLQKSKRNQENQDYKRLHNKRN